MRPAARRYDGDDNGDGGGDADGADDADSVMTAMMEMAAWQIQLTDITIAGQHIFL